MLILLSPAKTLDFESSLQLGEVCEPLFLQAAEKVNRSLRRKSRKALTELQGISYQLASLNYDRNQNWSVESHKEKVRQSALAFKGDVYQGMQAWEWSEIDMQFAQEHLLILSGMYGLLRPRDGIMPYRLEMGTSLKVGRRENLYEFWKDKLRKYFRTNIDNDRLLVNLASNEYFKAIVKAGVSNPVLNIEFKEFREGKVRMVTFFAKKARGMMANYIIRNQITHAEDLKGFDTEGYYFDDKSSSHEHYVFLR